MESTGSSIERKYSEWLHRFIERDNRHDPQPYPETDIGLIPELIRHSQNLLEDFSNSSSPDVTEKKVA